MTIAIEAAAQDSSHETTAGVAATMTSSASVLSCAACCVLPLALPAAALAGAGATLAWLESASPWLRVASVAVVLAAWWLVWRQNRQTGKRAARSTLILLGIASLLTFVSLIWEPLIEAPLIALLQ